MGNYPNAGAVGQSDLRHRTHANWGQCVGPEEIACERVPPGGTLRARGPCSGRWYLRIAVERERFPLHGI